MKENTKISFRDNIAGSFGLVLRSSAIFYYRKGRDFRTTISFMNYWKIKRGLDVAAVASVRRMDGRLLRRESLPLGPFGVVNYDPVVSDEAFEGSIEIEIFATENLVIPYAAIMAVYESRRGISTVHSYARGYSRHEVEEGRTLSRGAESCWSLRDADGVRSLCVFHNGPREVAAQRCRLEVMNHRGEVRATEVALDPLNPYATTRLSPADHVPDLVRFLDGRIGQASLSFSLGEGFTRMLVGNEATDGGDFQITHSNFDYARQATDTLDEIDKGAFMRVPDCGIAGKEVIVYPQMMAGHYTLDHGSHHRGFASGDLLVEPVGGGDEVLCFRRSDGPFPTRLVTGLTLPNAAGILPNECSLGVLTHLQPRKRLWWGICATADRLASRLVMHDLPEVYGGMPEDSPVEVSLYGQPGSAPLTAKLDGRDLRRMDEGIAFDELFPRGREHLEGGFGYYTLTHPYGGLTCYTLFDNQRGSRALEHGF